MTTINQLVRKKRKNAQKKYQSRHLEKCPQKRGIVLYCKVVKPKKPNSAERKVCRVRLTNGEEVTAHIPGKDHNLVEHSQVLIRGGRTKDLPGCRYKVVRGKLGCKPVQPEHWGDGKPMPRNKGRSRYGVKKEKKVS